MSNDTEQQLVEDPFNRTSEIAIINLVPPAIQDAILKAHAARPDLFGLEEYELERILEKESTGSLITGMSGTDNAIRMKFWLEYDMAQAEGRKMKMLFLTAGVCDPVYLYKTLIKNPRKVAWILTRPASYESTTEEMHLFALKRLRKTLEQDPMRHGKFDSRLADQQVKIFLALDARVKGAVVQKTLNVHSTVTSKPLTAEEAARSPREQLERRLEELERLRDKDRGKVIDASPISVE